MTKPKLGFYWCAACGGCEETVVDLAEDLLDLVARVEIAFWPCAMDFKRSAVEALPDQGLEATLLNGAIRTTEQEAMAWLLRRKSKYLIAFGACAQMGGIPALANQFSREQLLSGVYDEAPTTVNPGHARPQNQFRENGRQAELPRLHEVVRALDQVVPVDYYLPGCPPTPKLIQAALTALLAGRLPPKGAVLAPDTALCQQCPRRASKPEDLSLAELTRPHKKVLDPDQCFLAQGVVCLGPATRAGCEAACPGGNMPCTGCFGPTSRVRDHGAKMLAALGANLKAHDPAEIDRTLAGLPDPVGTFYRYGLAKSLVRRRVNRA